MIGSQASLAALDPRLSSHCYNAIARASDRTGVPREVMLAISLTETGKKLGGRTQPWPWTVNMEGKGLWFEDQATALAYVKAHFTRGARSFDVGCFQINYRWHHQHFDSVEDMFDPDTNARYAAKFLTDLYIELGSWSKAAGAYHSRTREYSDRYRKRFDSYLARLRSDDVPDAPFGGHGSEPLPARPGKIRTPSPWPGFDVARSSPLLSETASPLGSLASGQSGQSGGLLRRASRTLY